MIIADAPQLPLLGLDIDSSIQDAATFNNSSGKI
jgi:hypothetical protein